MFRTQTSLGNLILAFLTISILTGCTAHQRYDLEENTYTPYAPTNYTCAECLPQHVKRVVLLPIYSEDVEGQLANNLDDTLGHELQKQNRFEVVKVSRHQLKGQFRKEQMSSVDVLPYDLLEKFNNKYAADAVLFVDLTEYRPYKPMALGMRSKLVDVFSGDLLWSFDETFDTGNPHVAVAARRFQLGHQKTTFPLDSGTSVLKSPHRFSQYVAYNMFRTLPVR